MSFAKNRDKMLKASHVRRRSLWSAYLGLAVLMAATVRAADPFHGVYISELLVDSLPGDGRSGWVELYNGGTQPVDLDGWFLTDSSNLLSKWRFPPVGILPGQYLVVWASGSGATNDLTHLCTNFRLSDSGGYLALVRPEGSVVSDFSPYPKQSPGVSYGRVCGEPATTGSFTQPSPGKPNQTSGQGFAPKVFFSRVSGSLDHPVDLKLSCESSNAVIHYTLDGRQPTRRSPIYETLISLTNSVCVRARAYQEGLLPGPPRSENYLMLSSDARRFTSTLPILVMDTFGALRTPGPRYHEVRLSFYEPVQGLTSLTNPPTLSTRGGFHVRGSTSAQMPQPGFAMQFLDEFDREQHLSALGLPANSDWVLYAPNEFDPIMIHNPFIHQLSRDLGHYSPRTRFLEVFLVRHAGPVSVRDYFGVFVLEEKIKVGKHRVAIDRLGPEDVKEPEVTGGYLVKFDRLGPGESGFWGGGASMVYVEPKEAVIRLPQRAAQRHYLASYFEQFDHCLYGPDWKDPQKGYRAFIDVNSWIDFHVLEVLSGNVDALSYSTFFYKPRNGKITYGPHWDFDRALGSTDGRDADPSRWNTGRFFDAPWWSRLFSDPDFWQLWVDRWQELRRTQFSESNLFGLIDRLTQEVREAQPREVARWGLEPRGGTYQSEIDGMKSWLGQRIDFIDQQLAAPPRLAQMGGEVNSGFQLVIETPDHASVYYTLDGSDPRAPQGAVATNAVLYSEPITLLSNARVVARARDPRRRQRGGPPISTPWSGPASAYFSIKAK